MPVAAFMAYGCATREPAEPRRSERGDTVVVENVGPGAWGQDGRLEETLRIGRPDGPEEYWFGHIGPLAVDRGGRVFVYDSRLKSLRLFDSLGNFVRRIGKTGSGPGEFQRVMGLIATDSGVVVWDPSSSRLTWFGSDGALQKDEVVATGSAYFTQRALSADTLGMLYIRAPSKLMRVDASGKPVGDVAFPGASDSRGVTGFFATATHWTLFPDGRMASGRSGIYSVDVPGADNRWLRITRAVEPDGIGEAERSEYDAILQWLFRTGAGSFGNQPPPPVPATRPYFDAIDRDTKGRIWVLRNVGSRRIELTGSPPVSGQPRLSWRNNYEYDVFAQDGSYLGRVPLDPTVNVWAIHGDDVWAVATDENDVEYIARYRLIYR